MPGTETVRRQIPWTPYSPQDPRPLGRSVEHDPKSREFEHRAMASGGWVAVYHPILGLVLPMDQKGGSCTGHAATEGIGSDPVYETLPTPVPVLNEDYALGVYDAAEIIDGGVGYFKGEDNGSSGLSAAKVLKRRGLIKEYQHTFSLTDALDALQTHPILIGSDWLTPGMDEPDQHGVITVSGSTRGGHEYLVDEFVPAGSPRGPYTRPDGSQVGDSSIASVDEVGFWQTWGQWGYRGRGYMPASGLGKLLAAQGDVIVLIQLDPATPDQPPVTPGAASFPDLAPAALANIQRLAARRGETPGQYLNYRFRG